MGRLAWSQLRFRTARLVALLAGLLLATTAFTVLTAASRTAQLRTVGTVSSHFVPSYEILVRPRGARTGLEEQTGTVQPDFLAGIYGGITMAQYHEIAGLPGVSVAAPIATVGYALLAAPVMFTIPAADYRRPGRRMYRYQTMWVSDDGTSRDTQPASYTYVTPEPLRFNQLSGDIQELVPGHGAVTVCPYLPESLAVNPFGIADQSAVSCWSKVDGTPYGPGSIEVPAPGYDADWVIPVLIAAIDPVAEAKLDGLDHAVVSGHYLADRAGTRPQGGESEFPVLASSASGMDEYAITTMQRLGTPKAPPDMTVPWLTGEASIAGQTLVTERTTAQQAYQQMLRNLASSARAGDRLPILGYWSIGPVSYGRTATGALQPVQVDNPLSVWQTAGVSDVSMDNQDNAYRQISAHTHLGNQYAAGFSGIFAAPKLVGTFDPARIRSFSRLSEVPLGGYQPIVAAPATAASRRALHGADLLPPNQNLGGYVSQPVNLITTLSALPALQNSVQYGGDLHVGDPISVIRVRVAGVTGPNPVSLERIRVVAQQIAVRTHLDVDIVAGSSPAPAAVGLPAGKFGQPALLLTEFWVKKGVAEAILSAVDKDSLVLFVLILVVCVLFVANSATAAIRGRRRELGVLACLGWTRPRLFTAVLGELTAIGLTAGVLGAAAALPLSTALGLRASPGRAALAVPIATAVALIAGLIPAWVAARADPVASVRPAVLAVRRGRQPDGVTGLAATNVLRSPGHALVGAVSLAAGITALTMVAALSLAFSGVVVGTLLGDAVAVQVRGVDYVAVAATLALGVLAVADAVFLNITERAAELAALRAFGWRESALSRLVVTEGVITGLAGSLAGAAIGLGAAATFAGQAPGPLYLIAAAAVVAGVLVTAAAAVLPAQALRRLPAAHVLAAD
jgi:hypothetical protein